MITLKPRNLFTLILLIFILLAGCFTQNSEVRNIAQSLQDSFLIKCGDAYYRLEYSDQLVYLAQYEGVSLNIRADKLSEAARRNGYEWTGEIKINYKLRRRAMIKRPTGSDPSQWKIEPSRLLEDFKGWGEWEEHSEGFNTIERYTPIKKDGKWTITTGVAGLGNVRAYMLADSPLSVLIDKNKEISIPFDCTNISH